MIMITVTILALVLVYKSFCNTVCIYMVMQIKLVVVVEGKMRAQEIPRMSEKYHRKQVSEWNKVEMVFHQWIAFDVTARPAARDKIKQQTEGA